MVRKVDCTPEYWAAHLEKCRLWTAQNKEKVSASNKRYRLNDLEKDRARCRAKVKTKSDYTPEKWEIVLGYSRKWKAMNKGKISASNSKYRSDNLEAELARSRDKLIIKRRRKAQMQLQQALVFGTGFDV